MFVGVLMEMWEVSIDWEYQMNSLAKKMAWGDLQQKEAMDGALSRLLFLRGLEEHLGKEKGGFCG